jgi:hypothetical protein
MPVYFPLQRLLDTFFTPINVRQVTLEMQPERHVGLCVKCPIKKKWNVLTHFSEIIQHPISKKSIQGF